ncbi:MAG: acyl-CoA thioesterase [Actinomycetes bacterium]
MTVVRMMMQRRIADLDGQGHVNNVKYSEYIQEARVNLKNVLLGELAPSFSQVVAKMEINYKVSLLHGYEPVPIDAWISRIGNKSYDISYVLYDEQGRVSLTAIGTMVATSGGNSHPIPEDVRAVLESHMVVPTV